MNEVKTREEIIHSMCMTYRDDYELNRNPDDAPWIRGMTKLEQQGLLRVMTQIYDENIAPILRKKYNHKNN